MVVADQRGELTAYQIGDEAAEIELNLAALPPETPPALLQGAGGVLVLSPPSTSGSFLTHPVALSGGGLAFVDEDGAVVVSAAVGNRRFEIDALPDARPVLSSDGRLALYAGPTDEYAHGVLGDAIEALRIEIIDTATLSVVQTLQAPDGEVFEGLSPLWADVDGDSVDELVATLSGPVDGARVVVYSESGSLLASSPPIGQGLRWRHQLAAGPFGPDGQLEIVDVRTPHIGGKLEYLRIVDGTLESVVAPGEYQTHALGSRNLDQALGVALERGLGMLVPAQDQRSLVLAQRTDEGVSITPIAAFSRRLATNLAGTTIEGTAVVAAALSDGTVLIWR